MGLERTGYITYFGDDEWEWGILEDLEKDLQIDMKSTYGFFSNGAGGGICGSRYHKLRY